MADYTVERFLEEAPAPNLPRIASQIAAFVDRHAALGRPIACVTSGGTTVPLERHCVRFIDNFSRGNRGAFSVEQFLASGYAVIFITRTGSAQPFAVEFQERLGVTTLADVFKLGADGSLGVDLAGRADLVETFRQAQRAQEEGTYLQVPFTTLFEYLKYLEVAARRLHPFGRRALFYLAAAVSDFFVPWSELVEHKIQSDNGPLTLTLQRVPKALATLRQCWAPNAMIVSFKLETDIDMLAGKAAAALRRYGVHLVVANQLETRKDTVYLVTASMSSRRADARQREQQKSLGMTSEDRESAAQDAVQVLKNIPSDVQVTRLDRPPHIEVIEELLVDRIVSSHRQYMNGAAAEDACQP